MSEIQTDGGKIKETNSMGEEKFWEENNQYPKQERDDLEANLPMVTYIMLHRIYDLLTLISNKIVGSEDTSKMVQYHDQGYLLGPVPSYTPQSDE